MASLLGDRRETALSKSRHNCHRADASVELPSGIARVIYRHIRCEHVTAILKHPVKDGQQRSTYELVDSLPQAPSGMGVRIKCEDHAVLKVSTKNKNKKASFYL